MFKAEWETQKRDLKLYIKEDGKKQKKKCSEKRWNTENRASHKKNSIPENKKGKYNQKTLSNIIEGEVSKI